MAGKSKSKAAHKTKGSSKDFAAKQTLNPGGREPPGSQTHEPFEQDRKRRIGQFSGTGEPPLMKK